jgi:hypothetical protein
VKLPLFAIIAFVIGLAGGTGVGVMRAPKPSAIAAADSARTADSTKAAIAAGAAPVEIAHPKPDAALASAGAGALVPVPDSSKTVAPHDSLSTETIVPAPLLDLHAAIAAQALAAREPRDFKSVALILTNMKPTDAAKIMAFLGDDLVEGIVRSLGPRQAAVLMVQLPPERAAALSRKLIQHPKGEGR